MITPSNLIRLGLIALALMLAPSLAHAVSVTWPITVSAPSNVTLDSTIFTGARLNTPNGGDTIVANIVGCTGPSDCTVGGTDGGKFKVVAARAGLNGSGVCTSPITPGCPAGWINSANGGPRNGPFLMTNGNQGVCTVAGDGCHITLNGTPFVLADPPAPSTSGAIVVSAGGNIQAAINGAGGGVPVFLRCGTYSGGFSANGHNVIGATTQNHVNGETCRAKVNGGTIDISGGTVYGIDLEGCSSPCITGSGGTLTNNIINLNNGTPINQPTQQFNGEWFCQGGNNTMQWNSFYNADGAENACGGGTPFTFRRNYEHNCGGDCNGVGSNGTYVVSDNFIDVNNTNDVALHNLGSAIECSGCNGTWTINNNYVLNAGSGGPNCCGGYGWSLISGRPGDNLGFRYNYTAGHDTNVEASAHGVGNEILQDNYQDFQNIQNIGVYNNAGIFNTGSPGECCVTAQRNNEIPPPVRDDNIATYSPGNTINVGIPAPFTSGASGS